MHILHTMCHHADLRILTRSNRVAILDPVQNESNILKNKVLEQFDLSWSIIWKPAGPKALLKTTNIRRTRGLVDRRLWLAQGFRLLPCGQLRPHVAFPCEFWRRNGVMEKKPKKKGKTSTTMGWTTVRFSERNYYIIWLYLRNFSFHVKTCPPRMWNSEGPWPLLNCNIDITNEDEWAPAWKQRTDNPNLLRLWKASQYLGEIAANHHTEAPLPHMLEQ